MRSIWWLIAASLPISSPGLALAATPVCQAPAYYCAPGAKGPGGCFDPKTSQCGEGAIAFTMPSSPSSPSAVPDPSPTVGSSAPVAPSGGACTTTPSSGDQAALLEALRPPVSASLRMKVDFTVERTRVCGDWAFVLATPQLPGGGEPNWAGTVCDGDTSHLAGGLMRRDGGTWRLLEYALCPSDVAWADWPARYGTPATLFDE